MKKKQKKIRLKTREDEVNYISKALGYQTLVKPAKQWLNTGFRRLNKTLGSEELGLSSGKLYLIAGKESSGKSVLAAKIAGIGQADGWDVGWVDGENSYDPVHVRRHGLHSSKVALFSQAFGNFKLGKKEKKKLDLGEVEPAEYLFTRVELWMKLRRKLNPKGKLIVVIDSTNSFMPMEEQKAGYVDANMRTKSSVAVFLNQLQKRFGPLAVHTNAIVILIAQLRTNPAAMFGNPEYISGGAGLKFFPSSINWMRRVSAGKIYEGDRQVGVRGLITNMKNKVGGGSVEGKKAGYEVYFFKDRWKFLSSHDPRLTKKKKKKKEI